MRARNSSYSARPKPVRRSIGMGVALNWHGLFMQNWIFSSIQFDRTVAGCAGAPAAFASDRTMYIPEPFAEPRLEALHRIIREHPLGLLITHGPDSLDANHLPFLLDADAAPEAGGGACGALVAHVARANPVWSEARDGDPVLVVFRGAQGYISPSWYPGKQETHRRVPTWNYEVVHAHGSLQIRDDEKFVRGVVARLTRQHEAALPQPWKIGDAPPDFIA